MYCAVTYDVCTLERNASYTYPLQSPSSSSSKTHVKNLQTLATWKVLWTCSGRGIGCSAGSGGLAHCHRFATNLLELGLLLRTDSLEEAHPEVAVVGAG